MKIEPGNIYIKEYNYDLPHARIAHFPLTERDQSKLLVYKNGLIKDDRFYHLPDHLPNECSIILNDTRVIEARILFQKQTGGVIEIFCLEPFEETIEGSLSKKSSAKWLCLIGGASKWKPGLVLQKQMITNDRLIVLSAKYAGKQGDRFIIEFTWSPSRYSFADVLHTTGSIPLPPYIKRDVVAEDKERYQTVFCKNDGSVAAPTAALHFTSAIFQKIAEKNINTNYLTLHVGAGTFKPVKSETLADHQIHKEPFAVSKKVLQDLIQSKTVIAVGTTSLRSIESLYWLGIKMIKKLLPQEWKLEQWEVYELEESASKIDPVQSLLSLLNWMEENDQTDIHCHTGLIIVPGYDFKIVSGLITNFHQPQSTLLLLVSAFIGEDWKKVYSHALDNDYRFLSYGDSSLLWRDPL